MNQNEEKSNKGRILFKMFFIVLLKMLSFSILFY